MKVILISVAIISIGFSVSSSVTPTPSESYVVEGCRDELVLKYSTYVGGSGDEYPNKGTMRDGISICSGVTDSDDFPTFNSYQSSRNSSIGKDGIIVKLDTC